MTRLDSDVTAKLQQWLRTKVNPVTPQIRLFLEQLHQFAWQVHSKGFDSISRSKTAAEMGTALELIELIANLICRGINTNERPLAIKSLQETLFMCTDVQPDVLPTRLGERLESYLALSGSKGLIRVFLSVHLSNLIFMDLHDSLQARASGTPGSRIEAIERLCQSAATVSVRSWEKWPQLTHTGINSAAHMACTEIKKAVSPKGQTARPKS